MSLTTERDIQSTRAEAIIAGALDRLERAAPAWWLHIDLDVLRTADFAAADYPQPGGLTWAQLCRLAGTALQSPQCAGASVVIYNAELDPDRRAARDTAAFIAAALSEE